MSPDLCGFPPPLTQGKDDALTAVWAVDQVCTEQGSPLRSAAALMTSYASNAPPRWTCIQRSGPASPEIGRVAALRLDGADGPVGAGSDMDTLLVLRRYCEDCGQQLAIIAIN